jgi:hypothetical protein
MTRTSRPSPLRSYQLDPYRAILRAAVRHDADSIVVRMSRQAGKNELSARVEAALISANASNPSAVGVKAAPTQDPQAVRSLARLATTLRAYGFQRPRLRAGGDHVYLDSASWWFGSGEPEANVVGATASLLLEFDEAQDFAIDKHDRDYRPMAAATAAATVYYGTAWTDFDLLALQREEALKRQVKDGRQRVFDIDWTRVANEVPAYGLFVEAERERLGHTPETPHVAFMTQYELKTLDQQGRLLTAAQLERLHGSHPRQTAPGSPSHNVYVFGIDVSGSNMSGAPDPDETVVTVGRSRFPGRGRNAEPITEIVEQYAWAGRDDADARAEVERLAAIWRPVHFAVDATGIGEPLASWLIATFGERKVTAIKFTAASKSSLGHDMLAAINVGALKLWAPGPNDSDHAALTRQFRLARRELRPDGRLAWYVDQRDGHDDRLISTALTVRAAQRGKPRIARSYTGGQPP